MKKNQNVIDPGRRGFVTAAAAAGLGGVVAAALPATSTALTETPQASAVPEGGGKGYQLTQHVIDYYKSATS